MSTQEMRYCKRCEKPTLFVRPSTAHVLHFLLSIITFGVWLIVWWLIGTNNKNQGQCTSCGTKHGVFGLTAASTKPRSGMFKIILGAIVVLAVIVGIKQERERKEENNSISRVEAGLSLKSYSVPSDVGAKYYAVELSGKFPKPIFTSKRVGSSGTSFSRREFDCDLNTGRYLGTGDTIEQMNNSQPDPDMYEMVQDSVSWHAMVYACDNAAK